MSAFRVHKLHIDVLVNAGMDPRIDVLSFWHDEVYFRMDGDTPQRVGTALIELNNNSVNTLYHENCPPEPYTVETVHPDIITPINVLCLIAGLRYQSCEHPKWQTTFAASYLNALERAAIRALPGYTDAPWSLTPDTLHLYITGDAQ